MELWKVLNLGARTMLLISSTLPLSSSLWDQPTWRVYSWIDSPLVGSLVVKKIFLWAKLWFSRLSLMRWIGLPNSGAHTSHMPKSCLPLVLLLLKLILLFLSTWSFMYLSFWFRTQVGDRVVQTPMRTTCLWQKALSINWDGWQPFKSEVFSYRPLFLMGNRYVRMANVVRKEVHTDSYTQKSLPYCSNRDVFRLMNTVF